MFDMQESGIKGKGIVRCFKVLGAAYAVSAVLLLLLAVMVYKFGIPEKAVSIGIVLVYILSCLLAGVFMGKIQKNKRFLWGIVMGAMYFSVLLLLTGVVGKGFSEVASDFGTTLFICLGSGMLGGMIS